MSTGTRKRAPNAGERAREVALLRWLATEDVRALRRALADPASDPARFLRFAHRHKLGAFSYWALRRLGLTETLSPAVVAAAKAGALRERSVNEKLTLQLRELRDAFERSGAEVLFLKGPLFSQRFYGDIDARGVADIDILSRREDVDRIEGVLLESGFERAFHVPVGRRMSRFFAHHFEYRRNALPLDLHWALQRHYSLRIDERRIWDTASWIDCVGRTFRAPSAEYELVLQILGVVTDLQVGKLTLRPIVDIYRILRAVDRKLEWAEFFSWRERERTRRPSAFVLSFVLDVLDCAEEFPELSALLQPMRASLPRTSRALSAALRSRPTALGHKLLALRLYETPLAAAISWWLVSLPFRFAVYGVTREPFDLARPRGRVHR